MDMLIIIGTLLLIFMSLLYVYNELQPIDQKFSPSSKKWILPPGPKGVPLLGNLLEFSHARDSGSLGEWLSSMGSYGEMTTLHMGSHLWVLLNRDHVIRDLIARNSRITSERPDMPIASGLVSHHRRSVVQKEAIWHEARRAMGSMLTSNSLRAYSKYQEMECASMLMAYLKRPQEWYNHHSRYTTAIMFRIVLGETLTKSTTELSEHRQVTMEFLTSLFQSFVDFFPKLENLPVCLQFWRRKWEEMGNRHRRLFRKWWDPIRSNIDQGIAPPCFVKDVLLDPASKYPGSEEDAIFLANSIIAAGGDNTRMTMNAFVMASICFPENYKKARNEIDSICGSGDSGDLRLPGISDMQSMPYICALLKEVMRWRPIVPLIPPHQLTEDLHYEGYLFPKGTNFLINGNAACNEFQSSEEFEPERWIDSEGNQLSITYNFWGFGGGRRICAGYRIAQQTLFLAFSRLIFCFDYAPNGFYNSHKLNPWMTEEPFPISVMPRSENHAKLIEGDAKRRGLL